MPAPTNTFKQMLLNGTTQIGCWVGLADGYAAEISATAGFDWLLIDGEHAPNDLRSIMAQLQVIGASSSHPVVRIPEGDTCLIKQVLEIGAQSLLIPMVDSAEQAAEWVRATRYPPQGVRGVGSALARASMFNSIPDYLTTANDQICLLLQAESAKAIAALDDILATDGVDGVFIGPSDLAADMGYLGNANAPEVQEVIQDALARIRAAGKAAGILSLDNTDTARYVQWGAQFVAVGVDVILFASAMTDLARHHKSIVN